VPPGRRQDKRILYDHGGEDAVARAAANGGGHGGGHGGGDGAFDPFEAFFGNAFGGVCVTRGDGGDVTRGREGDARGRVGTRRNAGKRGHACCGDGVTRRDVVNT
jgi:DnaJ-class molecular chaperone